MPRRVIFGSLIGAIIIFAWISTSWMYLPYHMQANQKFTDESAVAAAISENAPTSGVYVLPNPFKTDSTASEEDQKAAKDKSKELMKSGPIVFASVLKQGDPDMTQEMIVEFATDLAAALLFCLILLHLKPMNYFRRLFFVLIFAVTVAVISDVPNWNWWHFSDQFIIISMMDKIIAWFLAGMVMSLVVKTRPPAK